MTTAAHLIILRASRLEALVPPLMTALAQTCPEDTLAPQTVIAAHPGMRQWLTGAMARHAGTTGVVANVEVILPSAWAWITRRPVHISKISRKRQARVL